MGGGKYRYREKGGWEKEGKEGETGKGETEIERENDERMGVAGVNERGGRYRDRERGGWGEG